MLLGCMAVAIAPLPALAEEAAAATESTAAESLPLGWNAGDPVADLAATR